MKMNVKKKGILVVIICIVIVLGTFLTVNLYTIVGYDDKTIYAAESLKYKTNADNEHYNRTINNKDFEKMWETGVFRKNTYITIKK
jgi:predicted metalloprotease